MSLRVWVVEDEEGVRALVCAILERGAGAEVELFGDGESALAAVGRLPPPDVLVTDATMPGGMSGLEAARRITELAVPPPAVVLMSGSTVERERATARGWIFLEKPFRMRDLSAAVGAAARSVAAGRGEEAVPTASASGGRVDPGPTGGTAATDEADPVVTPAPEEGPGFHLPPALLHDLRNVTNLALTHVDLATEGVLPSDPAISAFAARFGHLFPANESRRIQLDDLRALWRSVGELRRTVAGGGPRGFIGSIHHHLGSRTWSRLLGQLASAAPDADAVDLLVHLALIAPIQDLPEAELAFWGHVRHTWMGAAGGATHALLPVVAVGAALGRSDRGAALAALARAPGPTAARIAAIGLFAENQADPGLLPLLADPDPGVRRVAAEPALRRGAVEEVARLLDDPEPGVALAVARTLARSGGDRAIEALHRRLRHHSPAVRADAVLALGDQPAARGLLSSHARAEEDELVKRALRAVLGDDPG